MSIQKALSFCLVVLSVAAISSAAVNSSSSFEERIETAVKTIAPATLNLKYGDRDKTYTLAVGQDVLITLRANPALPGHCRRKFSAQHDLPRAQRAGGLYLQGNIFNPASETIKFCRK